MEWILHRGKGFWRNRRNDFKSIAAAFLATVGTLTAAANDPIGDGMPAAASRVAGDLGSPVRGTFDFRKLKLQLEGADGGSVCQFHSVKPDGSAAAANVAYSTLGGFPDDNARNSFGLFCDTAFSTNGMGLSQLWATPCPLQTPPESLGDHYETSAWPRLDFSMYEPGMLQSNRYYTSKGKPVENVRGHTVAMLLASLRRARIEGMRVSYWTDVHTDFPSWMWKDGLRKNPVRDDCFNKAVLHIVYFVKYLTAKHGIPIHAASFCNEPDMPGRHHFSPAQLLMGAKILRERLDEAGLHGVRVMPCTAISMSKAHLDWAKTDVDTLNTLASMLEGAESEYAPNVDILAGHGSQSETPIQHLPLNTRPWRASGDFNEHWTNSVGFDMGPPEMIDDVIRHNMWLYGKGVSQCGIWQVASRMGIGNDFFRMPEVFDPGKFGRPEALSGASVVYPFLRPGMFTIDGSLGRIASAAYSADGFGGRGHREVVVLCNNRQERRFEIQFKHSRTVVADLFRATVPHGRQSLGQRRLQGGRLAIVAPADSVTTLVGAVSTPPRGYVVVKDKDRLTTSDRSLLKSLAKSGHEAVAVSQNLSAAEQSLYCAKRHPVDAFGAAVFVLSDSIDRSQTISAYRTVMAPVVVAGDRHAGILGLRPGARIEAGAPFSFRGEFDPSAEMLDGGLPRACGAGTAQTAGATHFQVKTEDLPRPWQPSH